MEPSRKHKWRGFTIEEFYWNGDYVVYINNKLFAGSFEQAIREAKAP